MKDLVDGLKSIFNCPCKHVTIKDFDIGIDLRSYNDKSLSIDLAQAKSSFDNSHLVSTATSKVVSKEIISAFKRDTENLKTLHEDSLQSSLCNIDCAKEEKIIIVDLADQVSRYLSVDFHTNMLNAYDNLFGNNFRLAQSIPLKAEISIGFADPTKTHQTAAYDVSLGMGISSDILFHICIIKQPVKALNACLTESNKVFLKTKVKSAICCDRKSNRASFEDQLSRTPDSSKFIGSHNKIYFQINKIFNLENDTETFVVLGATQMLKITASVVRNERTQLSGFKSDFSDVESSVDSTFISNIVIKLINFRTQKSKEFTFNSSKFKVTIGRNSSCDIPCADQSISKIHLTLIYSAENNQWIMMDGYKSKRSANGSWISLQNSCCYELETGANYFFRHGKSTFCIGLPQLGSKFDKLHKFK